jgi:hypothetical protein
MSVSVLAATSNSDHGGITFAPAQNWSHDTIVYASCANPAAGLNQPCRVDLQLSADGTTFVTVDTRIFSSAPGATSQIKFPLHDYLEITQTTANYWIGTTPVVNGLPRSFSAPWVSWQLRFSGNVGGAVTVSATADGAILSQGNYQLFTSSGIFKIPNWARFVRVIGIGGGGGGATGTRGASGLKLAGGGGGAGAGISELTWSAPDLIAANGSPNITVTVGAGGLGGLAQTADDTQGNPGLQGSATTFGTFLSAVQGVGGLQGNGTVAGSGGATLTQAMYLGQAGANGGTGGVGIDGNAPANIAAAGGGGGGGISSAGVPYAGGNGGHLQYIANPILVAGGTPGAAGSTGVSGGNGGTGNPGNTTSSDIVGGSGGGGGGATSDNTMQPGSGGNGGAYGSGGGGGPAILDGTVLVGTAGNGGNGAPGALLVMYW